VVSSSEAELVEAGDVEGLADAVRRTLARGPEVSQRALAARARLARDHAVDPWVRRYGAIYRSCLAD
jgi:hypothetical protein